jgi:C-terminal processing protease CtpA/Prc
VSSGEAVAIAFRGRPVTRFFGAATGGLSTANAPIPLRDGAIAVVTIGVDLDRTGRRYGGPVEPDEVVPGDGEGPDEPALLRAVEWIRSLSRDPARSPSPGPSALP